MHDAPWLAWWRAVRGAPMATIARICRYPVKGMSAEALPR